MKFLRRAKLLRDSCFALFYPRGCQICGGSVEDFEDGATCGKCWAQTRIFDFSTPLCQKCGRLLDNSLAQTAVRANVSCHRCDNDFYDAARGVGIYENALRIAVIELKEKPFVCRRLQNLLQRRAQNCLFDQITQIVPVPLHEKRLRERTFNQTVVLARILNQNSKIPILENCLTRLVHTPMHRVGMDQQARRESVETAFAVKQPRLVANEIVLLVDDVFTTGATVSRCAKVLKEAGAKQVFVLTLARAL